MSPEQYFTPCAPLRSLSFIFPSLLIHPRRAARCSSCELPAAPFPIHNLTLIIFQPFSPGSFRPPGLPFLHLVIKTSSVEAQVLGTGGRSA